MSGTCDCGQPLRGGRQQCQQCTIETDAVAVGHDEPVVERHEFAPECNGCGAATHVGSWLLPDGARAANGISDEGAGYFCTDCQPGTVEAAGDATEPAVSFEKASELRPDGGDPS